MPKYAVVADVHIWNHKRHGGALVRGVNLRAQLCLDVLREAVRVANSEQARLIVAGDLVDSAGPIQPQLAAAIRQTLVQAWQGCRIIPGNHDMTADNDTSLEIYETVGRNILTAQGVNFCDQKPDICTMSFDCDMFHDTIRDVGLLVGHFGVYDDTFPPYLRSSKGAKHVDVLFAYMKERNIRCMMLGDWHGRRTWQRDGMTVMQVGALCPTGWDNLGGLGYGTVALWDTETQELTWRELPGPRFCTVRSAEEEAQTIEEANRRGHKLFLRRYFDGERPDTPEGVEAYEAIPIAVEIAATYARACAREAGTIERQVTVDALVSEWLASAATPTDEAQILQQKVKEYLGS
jgi:hypothetical protein